MLQSSNNANSWSKRHRRSASLDEDEKKIPKMMEPKSEFSDSDEDDADTNESGLPGKSFKRRFSETFGTCFAVRKE